MNLSSFLNLVMLQCCVKLSTSEYWRLASVNVSQIIDGTHVDVTVNSEIRCASRAAQKGAGLYCYSEGRCITTDKLDNITGPATAGWNCKTTSSHKCIFDYDTEVPLYGTKSDNALCPNDDLVCTLSTPRITCCSDPFIMTSAGCLHYNSTLKLPWCEARDYCRALGAGLFTAESETHARDSITALRETGMVSLPWFTCWTSVRNGEEGWAWNEGKGRPVVSSEWYSRDFHQNITGWDYAFFYAQTNSGLCNEPKTNKYPIMCSAAVPAC